MLSHCSRANAHNNSNDDDNENDPTPLVGTDAVGTATNQKDDSHNTAETTFAHMAATAAKVPSLLLL